MDGAMVIEPLVVDVAEASPGGVVVVRLAGEFDLSVEKLFSEIVTDGVVRDGYASVVLDLAAVTFLGSSGIRALLLARKQALASGSRLSLRQPSPAVQRVLELTAVVDAFEIAP